MAELFSLRSRLPLIRVVLWLVCPLTVFLMVILKSPVIGFSALSRVRCAKERAAIARIAKMIVMNGRIRRFISDSSVCWGSYWGTRSKLSKSAALLKSSNSLECGGLTPLLITRKTFGYSQKAQAKNRQTESRRRLLQQVAAGH